MAHHDHHDDPAYASVVTWERRLDLPVALAALAAIPVTALHFVAWGHEHETFVDLLSWAVWLIFAAEVAVMCVVHPKPAHWLGHHKLALLVVLVTFPVFTGFAGEVFGLLRIGKLFKLLKFTKFLKLGKAGKMWKAEKILRTRFGLSGTRLKLIQIAAAAIAAIVLLSVAGLIAEGEHHAAEHGAEVEHVAPAQPGHAVEHE